jgi:tetratricopeptide (TPR) repeat protein
MKANPSVAALLLAASFMASPTLAQQQKADKQQQNKKNDMSRSYQALYAIAYLAEKNRNYTKAMRYYQAALQKKATGRAHSRLARIFRARRQWQQALHHAQKAVELAPKQHMGYVILGQLHFQKRRYDKTLSVLHKGIEQNPHALQLYYFLGKTYKAKGRISRAKRTWMELLHLAAHKQLKSKYLERTHLALANLFLQENKKKISLKYLERAYGHNPRNIKTILLLANLHKYMLEYQQALGYYKKLYQYYPGNFRLAANIAEIHFLLGQKEAMKRYLKEAIYTKGNQPKVLHKHTPRIAQALYFLQHGELDSAEDKFKRVLRKNYKDLAAHYGLYQVYKRQNQTKKRNQTMFTSALIYSKSSIPWQAERLLRSLQQKKPDSKKYLYHLALFYEGQKRYYQAILKFQKLTKQDPDKLRYKLHLAYLYGLTRQYQRSHVLFTRLIRQNPKLSQLHYFQGLIYYRQKEYSKAQSSFEKALARRNRSNYRFHLAATHERLGQMEQAIANLKEIVAQEPKSGRAYNFLGYLYAETDQNIDEAIELIHKALEFDPENAAYQDSLGWAFYKKGQLDKAEFHIQRSISFFRKENNIDPVAYDHLGDILHKKGQLKKAIRAWRKGVKIYQQEKNTIEYQGFVKRLQKKISKANQQLKQNTARKKP